MKKSINAGLAERVCCRCPTVPAECPLSGNSPLACPLGYPQAWVDCNSHQTVYCGMGTPLGNVHCSGNVLCCALQLPEMAVAPLRKHTLSIDLYICWEFGGRCFKSKRLQGAVRCAGLRSLQELCLCPCLWYWESVDDVLPCPIFALACSKERMGFHNCVGTQVLEESLITGS